MARRFQHLGASWEVVVAGAGTMGCSARRVEVTFRNAATGEEIPGRVLMAGEGRLTDDVLLAALAEALEARDSGGAGE
jgi:hypothetical protein